MSEKFQNKFRIAPARLQTWDYSSEGAYFITICTKGRQYFFGDVKAGKMVLSPVGIIANIIWYEIKNHVKNVELGAFVVMPNHIHGVLILRNDGGGDNSGVDNDGIADINDETNNDDDVNNDDCAVEKRHAFSLPSAGRQPSDMHAPQTIQNEKSIGQKRFQNQGKNTISSIVGSYKSAVTKHARRLGFEFAWQPSFHDHIIRDERAFDNIRNYIANNPLSWGKDKFHGVE